MHTNQSASSQQLPDNPLTRVVYKPGSIEPDPMNQHSASDAHGQYPASLPPNQNAKQL